MPSPHLKSRSLRRVFVRTPGSRLNLHYRNRAPAKAKCSSCGKLLSGVARVPAFALRNIPKSKKRPSRPYAGNLCSSCSRKLLIEKARSLE